MGAANRQRRHRVVISMTIPRDLLVELNAECEALDVSRSSLICVAIRQQIKRKNKQDQKNLKYQLLKETLI